MVRFRASGALFLLICLGSPSSAATQPSSEQQCVRHLQLIFESLQAFRRAEGDYPSTLSELHPHFLADIRILSCPIALDSRSFQFGVKEFRNALGTDRSTSYNYELNRGLTRAAPADGKLMTNREFKALQRKTPVGDRIPIVRCCNRHGTMPCLNLSFSGQVYPSPPFWEVNFRHLIPHPYLIPESIFRDTRPIPDRVPKRAEKISDTALSLSGHYNGCLADSWMWGKGKPPLEQILQQSSTGLLHLNAVDFDARGVIQVDAAIAPQGVTGFPVPMFPEQVADILVQRRASALWFLIGTLFSEKAGMTIGTIQITYLDGQAIPIPIQYGSDVADCLAVKDNDPGISARPVWTNLEGAGRLFLKPWTNPNPLVPIASFSITSAMSGSAPFVVAVSIKP